MGYSCKKCGGERFYGHQVCRMDVIVDGENNYLEPMTPKNISADVYDSSKPYGSYTCVKCNEEVPDDALIEQ